MNAFLNQWSTRAIWTYGRRPYHSAGENVLRDVREPSDDSGPSAPAGASRTANDDAACTSGGCASRVNFGSVPDIQNLLGCKSPVCARNQKAFGMRLERVDRTIRRAQPDGEKTAHTKRLELGVGGVIR